MPVNPNTLVRERPMESEPPSKRPLKINTRVKPPAPPLREIQQLALQSPKNALLKPSEVLRNLRGQPPPPKSLYARLRTRAYAG
eukprot:TRINITY_DN6429_c0_g1_i1.p3 TRINITY_DN6429_c0_g1~~TRINITY_DN6429_c0_g1_i1.p3  ORF type:complete len:84 (-),score=4.54 TRINITY_DN6429_c0_g1_i1:67-318(-)